jgi:hypothetical protein
MRYYSKVTALLIVTSIFLSSCAVVSSTDITDSKVLLDQSYVSSREDKSETTTKHYVTLLNNSKEVEYQISYTDINTLTELIKTAKALEVKEPVNLDIVINKETNFIKSLALSKNR